MDRIIDRETCKWVDNISDDADMSLVLVGKKKTLLRKFSFDLIPFSSHFLTNKQKNHKQAS